jgi:UDP-N-acetylglucosamine--N-acetylmuramyl-(pentapeptide) pyrophosphoryl-undecaprenol N-acetylglucosamine transferase
VKRRARPADQSDSSGNYAVVTGGGTSGHVLPALAIMDRLAAAGHDPVTLHYVGAERGIEQRLLPPTGYGFTLLDVVGLQRSLSRRNLMFLPKLVRATWQARRLIGTLQPRVVVNVGGYASMPATLAARLANVPIVVVSYDLRPGLASRLAARIAAATAAAFADSALPRARRTGAPIRPAIIALDRRRDRAAARSALGLPPERFVLSVFGGSLGAQVINEAVGDLVELAAARTDIAVHHVVGERWLTDAAAEHPGESGIMYHVIGYEERMPEVYAASDLMVTRSGASTIAELAATGSPAVLVPWPGAAENHQIDNARTLSNHGAAILVEQAELTGAGLLALVDGFIANPASLEQLSTAAQVQGVFHRGNSLIELIEEVATR